MNKYSRICFLLGVLLLAGSCARNPVTGKREFSLVSKDQEVVMGQQADPEIVAHFGLYEDQALQRFIDVLGQKMAAISHRSELNYSFKVLDSPVVNAFAVPGGYVYFTRGILAYFNNEAEFAGVLGHEIGHIAARHSASQQSKAMLAQIGLTVGMVVSPEFAQFGDLASQGVSLLFFKFGREDERESDRLGVEYATRIGYDAQEMAEFFLTLQRTAAAAGASPVPSFLSTHPSPEERLERVAELAAEWKKELPRDEYIVGRESYLRMIEGMVYGEDPRQGFFEDGYFFHPLLKFQFLAPREWSRQNTPQAVQMAPQDGKAMMAFTLVPAQSLDAAAQAILQKYQMQLIQSERVSVSGLPAIAMVTEQAAQPEQQRPAIRTLTYVIQYGNNFYSMMGVTAAQTFTAYADTFAKIANSFSPLNDPARLNRQPERIQIKPVPERSTLAQALRYYRVPDDRLEELAILNGMQLDDILTAGTLIKLVGR